MKKILVIMFSLCMILFPVQTIFAATHVVQSGESLWKISKKYQIGLSEIIEANQQIENPDLINPNQKVNIPTKDEIKSIEHQVIQYTNQEREKYGLSPLRPDWQLSRVARYKSEDMQQNNYFSHQSPTYGSPFNMMNDFNINYRSAAENIAQGQETPYQVVQAWMNSSGHRANILNSEYTHIGVGYVRSGNYWMQMFISK
ncbi:SafA/ExsA family spore coat assembly protein [Gracilibacillus thailandensis]|uniref:SafA/ExsA family spore coat assembly protein n=1 Tax=Gracilibacillus thailandensis TaxID=563735 RepID=A0A6N7R3L6_9BACI|nr:SafA/ExsA family spore coat assembly protein [Gracilibacillus thailandensis]MRI67797.1 SafA/ExsA family spore coat assembly protein [Gracilibacillus thailandensis]